MYCVDDNASHSMTSCDFYPRKMKTIWTYLPQGHLRNGIVNDRLIGFCLLQRSEYFVKIVFGNSKLDGIDLLVHKHGALES